MPNLILSSGQGGPECQVFYFGVTLTFHKNVKNPNGSVVSL